MNKSQQNASTNSVSSSNKRCVFIDALTYRKLVLSTTTSHSFETLVRLHDTRSRGETIESGELRE